MSLFEELKRRRVFRVVISYAITAWLVLQVADIATESFDAPGWVMQTLFTVLVLGFFVAIALSWVFQRVGGQLVRDRGEVTDATLSQREDESAGQRGLIVVLALALVLSGVLLWDRFRGAGPTVDRPPVSEASVAVLPFANMSASAENAYFSDGLTDTLLHQLAQVPELKVAARTSSFVFKDTNTDIREIARLLDVAHVLEGSVQRAGNTVRITAQLIQASDGYHVWSGNFDHDLDNIFAVQDEIAAQVASALTGALLETTSDSVRIDGGTNNTEAYDLFLQAREAFHMGTERSLARSNRLLRQAVTLDPEFALAWSHLAQSILRHGQLAGLGWSDVEMELAAASERGVSLAPDNSTTLAIRGRTLHELGNLAESRPYIEKALEIDPNNVWALSYLSDIQFEDNEFSAAIDSAQRAMALDPLDFALKADSTYKFLQVGEIEKAKSLAQAVLDQTPNSFEGLSAMGNIYWRTGDFAAAYRIYHKLLSNHPNTYYIYGRISQMFENLDDLETAERWIERSTAINEQRGKTRMAYFCHQTGRRECADSLFRELIARLDPNHELEGEWILGMQAALAEARGDWQRVYDISTELVELNQETDNTFSVFFYQIQKAEAAKRLGQANHALSIVEDLAPFIQESLANGGDSQYQYFWSAMLEAVREDGPGAASGLRASIERGYRDLPRLRRHGLWEGVRRTPEVQQVMAELEAINQAELERLRGVQDALGDI